MGTTVKKMVTIDEVECFTVKIKNVFHTLKTEIIY
jgi:hypothetical protein